MYDIIGDVHGHASQLEALLKKLGYEKKNGCYRHSERTVIFVGDLIDRGPEIQETVDIARAMVEHDAALIVMGNHEFNALAYNTPDPEQPGEFLRPHSKGNNDQYEQTLGQVKDVDNMLAFFYSMPLWLDLPELRVVHACWDPDAINHLEVRLEQRRLDHESLVAASRKGTEMYHAIETTLKGKEYSLGDITFADEGGKTRNQARVRWYLPYKGQSIAEYSFQVGVKLPESPFDKPPQEQGYHAEEKPVFFGHYWLPAKRPELQADNVCCLDYSVARGGHLCAYRFNADEPKLGEPLINYARARRGLCGIHRCGYSECGLVGQMSERRRGGVPAKARPGGFCRKIHISHMASRGRSYGYCHSTRPARSAAFPAKTRSAHN